VKRDTKDDDSKDSNYNDRPPVKLVFQNASPTPKDYGKIEKNKNEICHNSPSLRPQIAPQNHPPSNPKDDRIDREGCARSDRALIS
jgi:hypothetical protein